MLKIIFSTPKVTFMFYFPSPSVFISQYISAQPASVCAQGEDNAHAVDASMQTPCGYVSWTNCWLSLVDDYFVSHRLYIIWLGAWVYLFYKFITNSGTFCFHYFVFAVRCDLGFSGQACELATQTFPAFLSEGFSSPRLSSYHSFSSLHGAEVSFGCGVLASGKALVFNKDSRRHLVTALLDSSQAR